MLTWISVIVGCALILLAARDILLTLMTSTGRGAISRALMAGAWRTMRPVIARWRPYREIAGPLTFLGVIGVWATMIVVGWALIYWPFIPEGFLVDFGLDLQRNSPGNFLTALYFSMVVLVTLGFGDIVPTETWLRVVVPFEGLLGFGLITAGISWFLSIHPALSRRRRLAHQIALVREAEETSDEHWTADAAVTLLDSFATQLIDLRSDQIQFPVIYYFRDADPAAVIAPNLRYLLRIADWAHEAHGEVGTAIHLHQHMLRNAVHDYLRTVGEQFLDTETDDLEQLLELLTADHM